MSFESTFFQDKVLPLAKLKDFGFVEEDADLIYRDTLLEGQFEVILRVDVSGTLFGRVLDGDFNEDYMAFRDPYAQGHFVGQVRQEYGQLLTRIADECCLPYLFRQEQTNRLVDYVIERFADPMDQPFAKLPNFTVFRHPSHLKWYGLVGSVKRDKLQAKERHWTANTLKEDVEFINIKVDPRQIPNLLELPGIHPAYHMSKKSWVTILLDDSLSDEVLFTLVRESRALVSPKRALKLTDPNYWLLPANPKCYDIDAAFAKDSNLLWKHQPSMNVGDWVLIYMTSPIQAIRYICRVSEIYPSASTNQKEATMLLSLVKSLSDSQLPLAVLQEKGVKAIRGPRRATPALIAYLEEQSLTVVKKS
ncbi:EVE domain-containing protein [Streptococcus suis]|nr:EVE domain-containing protein [Streptococcus suis]